MQSKVWKKYLQAEDSKAPKQEKTAGTQWMRASMSKNTVQKDAEDHGAGPGKDFWILRPPALAAWRLLRLSGVQEWAPISPWAGRGSPPLGHSGSWAPAAAAAAPGACSCPGTGRGTREQTQRHGFRSTTTPWPEHVSWLSQSKGPRVHLHLGEAVPGYMFHTTLQGCENGDSDSSYHTVSVTGWPLCVRRRPLGREAARRYICLKFSPASAWSRDQPWGAKVEAERPCQTHPMMGTGSLRVCCVPSS